MKIEVIGPICPLIFLRTIGLQVMPEPPHQTDMRSQNLPPQTPPSGSSGSGSYSYQGSPAVLLVVTHPRELPAALQQHQKPVVIENTPANAQLVQDFERLLRWQKWKDTNRLLLIAALALIVLTQMVMSNRYGLEADWHAKWGVFDLGGKIKLTPSQ